jgi:aerobic carbon-monoxide dehydrogenase large subunit
MRGPNDSTAPSLQKRGIGDAVPRSEDPKLVRGAGCYTDDINLPDQAYAAIVRSTQAHGVIRSIDTAAARGMPGVLAVYTGTDLSAYGGLKSNLPFKNRDGSDMRRPRRPALATDKVRFVGDPVAVVVTETLAQAKDATEAVAIDVEPLPAVVRLQDAVREDAPPIWEEAPGNIALDFHYGDSEKVREAFARAAHVACVELVNSRVVVNAIAPRSAIAAYDAASGRFTLYSESQGVMGLKAQVADVLGVAPEKVRVVTHNVGGSFGMKAAVYPEYVCLLHAARELGRPVKWTDERSTSSLSDNHGRDHVQTVELALDTDGRFLALRLTGFGNLGGYMGSMAPQPPTLNTVRNVASVYRTPLIEVSTRCVFTNTTFVNPYRGAGRPEGNYYMERAIDVAAAEMGIDPVELRRRNLIRPDELPYHAASGSVYDSGDFPAVLDRALELADWKGFAKRRQESRDRGKLRGIGIGCFLEVTAPKGKENGAIHFEPDGSVTLLVGTLDYGQGHATPYAQVLSDRLGIPFERIRLVEGDSDRLLAGGGTGGSRSAMHASAAIIEAADKVSAQGKSIAAHVLEAAAADIEFRNGRFIIAGTDRSIGIMELAGRINAGLDLPEGAPQSLNVDHVSEGVPAAYPNGCHIAEVEIDPDTGEAAVVNYVSVSDFGTVINPLVVDGQVHGGVVQGIGQALLELTAYDADGQLLTGSFMDYALPRAHHAPPFVVVNHPVPAKTNPLGVKGCGEAGCAGGLASVMNAVADALSEYGIRHIDMPATPQRIWAAIQAAQRKAA